MKFSPWEMWVSPLSWPGTGHGGSGYGPNKSNNDNNNKTPKTPKHQNMYTRNFGKRKKGAS